MFADPSDLQKRGNSHWQIGCQDLAAQGTRHIHQVISEKTQPANTDVLNSADEGLNGWEHRCRAWLRGLQHLASQLTRNRVPWMVAALMAHSTLPLAMHGHLLEWPGSSYGEDALDDHTFWVQDGLPRQFSKQVRPAR